MNLLPKIKSINWRSLPQKIKSIDLRGLLRRLKHIDRLDDWVDAFIDRQCERIPAYWKPRLVLLRNHGIFWRVYLFMQGPLERFGQVQRRVGQSREIADKIEAANKLRREIEKLRRYKDKTMDEIADEKLAAAQTLEREAEAIRDEMARERREEDRRASQAETERAQALSEAASAVFGRCESAFLRFGEAEAELHAALLLFLSMLCMLGALAKGAGPAAGAAAFMLMWLGEALVAERSFISGGIRQRYIAGMLLRAAGTLVLLLHLLNRYVRVGVQINIILQSAIIVALSAHLLMFLFTAAFNRRQQLLTRMLSGTLGMVAALLAAAAAALAAAKIAAGRSEALGALLSLGGAVGYFIAEELMMATALGSMKLKYGKGWRCLFSLVGCTAMALGLWIMG